MPDVKNTILLSIFIFLGFATVCAQQATPSPTDASTWGNVAPANAGFKILMPAKATEKVTPVAGRPDLEHHLIVLETELAAYIVSYAEFPDEITDPVQIKEMLDRGREGGLASSKGQLKNEKEIKLGDYTGREWRIEIPGGIVATARAYWVKRRLYQTVFLETPKAGDTPELTKLRQEAGHKFLDSFALSEAGK